MELTNYTKTDYLEVIDTIGVPHPYCIGTKHVAHASDHFSGMLTEDAIIDAERYGARCEVKGCTLSYEEHEQAVLIKVIGDFEQIKDVPGLEDYLWANKEQCEKDGCVGFAFTK